MIHANILLLITNRFQQNFHKEIKGLHFAATKNGKDYY